MKDAKGRYMSTKNVYSDEEEIIDIYRHLSGQNKTLTRRTIKNLDTYYSEEHFLEGYYWSYDTHEKVTLYNLNESDLLNSFRALNELQQVTLLQAIHNQITSDTDKFFDTKCWDGDKKLLNDYHSLNPACQKLIIDTLEALLASSAGNEQNKNEVS